LERQPFLYLAFIMNNPPLSTSSVQEDILTDIPVNKVYKESTIPIAAFLAGPLAGGILMAENFRSLGKRSAATTTIILTVAFLVLLAMLNILPGTDKIPSFVYSILYTMIASFITHKYQRRDIQEHLALGGKLYPGWRAFLISIVCLIVTIAMMIGTLYLLDPSI
jgi:peptidoglycan/LPS O-acetylase OafA/YrhL